MNELVSLHDIQQAAARIRPVARVTPLLDLSVALPASCAAKRLLVKCENLQPAGAFKIRGAYNMAAQLSAAERAREIGVASVSLSLTHSKDIALAVVVMED